jgi:integral membrane protein (TIGR01906 family)
MLGSRPDYRRLLRLVATGLFVAAVPVFLIATNVRWVINAPLLYSDGFDRYEVERRTGIERAELLSAARQIRDYFNDDEEYLTVRVVKRGVLYENLYNPPLYTADASAGYSREVLHMKDVKTLVKGVYRVQEATGLYLAVFAIVGLAAWRRRFVPHLARSVALSGALTLGLVVLVGIGSLLGFDRLFLAFHQLSFSNDFWQLDPRRHYLIAMFPQGFFFYATMWIAGSTVVEALLLAVVPGAFIWWRPMRVRRQAERRTARTEATSAR